MNALTALVLPSLRALVATATLFVASPWVLADTPAAPVASAVAPQAAENISPAQADGRKLYSVHCIYCHGAGPGRAGTAALARRVGKDRSVLEARDNLDRAYVQYVVRHGLNAMLPLRRTELTDAELGRIIDWLQRPRVSQAATGGQP